MALIRLDKFISERTEYSRSNIKELAKKGQLSVNGIVEKAADRKIDSDKDTVSVLGKTISSQRYR